MDDFEQRLKADAAEIRADVSDELKRRVAASLHAAERAPAPATRERPGVSLWWFSSLTGIAAALAVIVFLNRPTAAPVAPPAAPTVAAVPDYVRRFEDTLPLNAEPAELTEPLEEELEKLKSDLDKARESLNEELRRTF